MRGSTVMFMLGCSIDVLFNSLPDEASKELEDNDITDVSAIRHCGATCELSTTETVPSFCPAQSCTDM